jgi:MoaA/NifB/PqqE/SkfB family radical SAM enzyme
MCSVDAVHVRRSRGNVVSRSKGLHLEETFAVDRHQAPDAYEFVAQMRQQRGLELTLEQKFAVLDNLSEFDAKIDFSGGDPMIQRENLEVMRAASQRFGKHNVTMTATGAGLARREIDDLGPIIGELNFTYDSPGAGIDPLRPETYARDNLRHAAEFVRAGVRVRAECPLTTRNCDPDTLTAIYRSLADAGVEKLLVMRLFASGRGRSAESMTPSREQYRRAIAHLRMLEASEPGPVIRLQCALRQMEGATASDGGNPCDLMRVSFGLLTDGTLLASPWAVNRLGMPLSEDWVLGNLAAEPLGEILRTTRSQAYRARLDENSGHCKIFAFAASTRPALADRIFDTTDPLYDPEVP